MHRRQTDAIYNAAWVYVADRARDLEYRERIAGRRVGYISNRRSHRSVAPHTVRFVHLFSTILTAGRDCACAGVDNHWLLSADC